MPAQQKKVAKPKSSADVGCSSTSPTSVSSASAIPPYEGATGEVVAVVGTVLVGATRTVRLFRPRRRGAAGAASARARRRGAAAAAAESVVVAVASTPAAAPAAAPALVQPAYAIGLPRPPPPMQPPVDERQPRLEELREKVYELGHVLRAEELAMLREAEQSEAAVLAALAQRKAARRAAAQVAT